ncbi:HlyD family efflux transporter periplasmic adaptor subunit [Flavobacterium ardleyense]|uniref:HlyD family efflux transporter periplasmic adaptor subunit n=1 Tax=Flavobacterium ardleyense TaxID=2038737 RepID=A0ABW5ZAH7_9FLAO
MEQEEQKLKKYSEEFRDIIDRFPTKVNYYLFYFLALIIIAMLAFGLVIESPDIVFAEVKVTAKKPPITLVAKINGKIKLIADNINNNVSKDEYIAIIENSANEEQIKILKDSLGNFNFKTIPDYEDYTFALSYNIGNIQEYYFKFLKTLYELNQYKRNNVYDIEIESLNNQLTKIKESISKSNEIITYKNENIEISKEKNKVDSILLSKGALIKSEFELSRKQLLKEKDDKASLENSIIKDRQTIISYLNKSISLNVEKNQTYDQLIISLFTNYQNILIAIHDWESNYTFKAPFDGSFELLRFISNGEFVNQGEPIFSILPANNKIIGQALMPISGAGKVKNNQKVIIKLDAYPYQEFGNLEGSIKSISLIPTQNLHLVNIEIPNGLVSNSGYKLNFSKEMTGQAEIITENKKLISRVFEKIKHAFDRKRNTEIIPKEEKKAE